MNIIKKIKTISYFHIDKEDILSKVSDEELEIFSDMIFSKIEEFATFPIKSKNIIFKDQLGHEYVLTMISQELEEWWCTLKSKGHRQIEDMFISFSKEIKIKVLNSILEDEEISTIVNKKTFKKINEDSTSNGEFRINTFKNFNNINHENIDGVYDLPKRMNTEVQNIVNDIYSDDNVEGEEDEDEDVVDTHDDIYGDELSISDTESGLVVPNTKNVYPYGMGSERTNIKKFGNF